MAVSTFSKTSIKQGFPKYQSFSGGSVLAVDYLIVAGAGGGGFGRDDSPPGSYGLAGVGALS